MAKTKKAEEMKNKMEVVFILDRSGSMEGLEADTIGGFNSTLSKQKKEGEGVIWSTVLFDDRYEVIHDRLPIEKIPQLTENEYYVRGCTALLDAIGRAVTNVKNLQKKSEELPEKTLFVITTDGMENASREFTYEQVKKLIKTQTAKGWEFLFLGANMDAVGVAGRMGIRPEMSATYINDGEGIQKNYAAVGKVMKCLYRNDHINEEALEEVRADFRKRKKS